MPGGLLPLAWDTWLPDKRHNAPEESLMLRLYVSSTDSVKRIPVRGAVPYAIRRCGLQRGV